MTFVDNVPQSLYTCDQVKKLDQLATEKAHISPRELMGRAAKAAWQVFRIHWPQAKSVAIVCGQGNNGGDGYAFALLAKQQGLQVTVYDLFPKDVSMRSAETQYYIAQWQQGGGEILSIPSFFKEEIIIDALLGTGARWPFPSHFVQTIETMNSSQKPILAIDIPSGLGGDLGILHDPTVKATVTVTLVGMKIGLVSHQGNEVVGKLYYDSLGVPEDLIQTLSPVAKRIEYREEIQKLPLRRLTANKSDQGHVLVIGSGKSQFGGAVCLAGEAALRAGAGLVSVIVAPESLTRSAHAVSELMITACQTLAEAKSLFKRATVILLGPGLSQNAWGEQAFHFAIKQSIPMVIDADGLNWLAKYPQKIEQAVLTPHPGEAARLLNTTVESVQNNRVEAVKKLQAIYGGVVVLKGAGTLVIDPNQQIHILAGAFPVLATAGTGDILAGMISALLAQKLTLADAAMLAVCTHALAAQAQSTKGVRGMIASDLLISIRSLLNTSDPST